MNDTPFIADDMAGIPDGGEQSPPLGTEEIDRWNEQAYRLRSTDLPRAVELGTRALEAARRLGYTRGVAAATVNRGIFETYASKNDEAFRLFLEALHLFESIGDRSGIASALRWVGVMYTRIGGNIVALEYFLKSHAVGVELGDTEHLAACLVNIGGAHSVLGDHHKALECFAQALDIGNYDNRPLDRATLLWNAGRAYEGLEQYERAIENIHGSLLLRLREGDRTGSAASMFALGDVYRRRYGAPRALMWYLRSLRVCEEVGFLWGKALCNHGIGALYVERNKPERALAYLETALEQAQIMDTRETLYLTHRDLAECRRQLGDIDAAYRHYTQFHTIKEELAADQLRHTIAYIRYGHEAEIARREAEIYRLKNTELADAYKQLADAFEEVKMLNDNLTVANRDLTRLNSEKNELLGVVSHDLKNPLASITLSTSIIRRYFDREIPATAMREIEKIEQTAERMTEAVTKLLDLDSIETGGLRLVPEACDIVAVVAQVAEEYRHRARAKNIEVHLEPAVPVAVAMVDRTAVVSVLDNLVSNAVKFSPHGKHVRIRIDIDGREQGQDSSDNGGSVVYVVVRDEGPGIREEDRERLFGKFSRLSARPTGGEHSTGLGLSIVHKLVTAMNGTIRCESKAGEGATFIVGLPAPA